MKYINTECELCKKIFNENDDVVVCPVCGAPHHRTCWQLENRCVHENEHQSGYVWMAPKSTETKTDEKATTTDWNPPVEMPDFVCQNGEKAVMCPKCGALNYANDIYCLRCHQPLRKENRGSSAAYTANGENIYEQSNGAPNGFDNQNEALYQAQLEDLNRFGGVKPDTLLDGIPVREYSDYVGGKNPGRIIRKGILMERFGRKTSFNFPALFLGPIWFMWRKMKKEAVIIFSVMLALGVSVSLLQTTEPLKEYYHTVLSATMGVVNGDVNYADLSQIYSDAQNIYLNADRTPLEEAREIAATVLQYVEMPGIPIVCCLFAIPLYRKKAKADIFAAREESFDMNSYRQNLIQRGGTSGGFAVLAVLVYFVIGLISTYLPLLLSFI